MGAKDSLRRAIAVELLRRENAQIFEDGILGHAAVSLGHQEHVPETPSVRRGTHQSAVDHIRYLDAGECRCGVQRAHFLGDFPDASALPPPPLPAPRHLSTFSTI